MSTPTEAMPSLWARVRNARVPQLLGVYAGGSFAALQGGDIFVERLGLPDWTFWGLVFLIAAGIPVLVVTALVQQGRKAEEGRRAETVLLARAEGRAPVEAEASVPGPSSRTERLRRLFTWQNTAVAGGGAVLLLTLLVGLYMTLRALGIGPLGTLVAAGVLDRDESILIADFQTPAGDSLLAGAVTEAFRIDFEQSPMIRVVGPGAVRDGLMRMQLPPESPLTPDLARELALREGIKAVLMGEIHPAGRGSILSVRLLATETEETIVSFRESVADSASIIPAVDRLSSRMRERIGESLRSIRASEPLERVSTSSLPALRRYSQGVRAAELERDFPTGIALLEEAVALDSTFAMAWRKLGVTLMNAGYPRERWDEAYTRAYRHRERLTDRERYLTQGSYYSHVTEEEDRAIVAYRTVLDAYPTETTALNNLAVILGNRGSFAAAAELYSRALAVDSTRHMYYTNLMGQQVALGDWVAAERTMGRYRTRFPDAVSGDLWAGRMAAARGEYEAAAEMYRRVQAHPRSTVQDRGAAEGELVNLALIHGRLEEARRHLEGMLETRRRMGIETSHLEEARFDLQVTLSVVADTAGALRRFDELLEGRPLPSDATAEGAHLEVAGFLLAAREPARARSFLVEWDALRMDDRVRRLFERARADAEVRLAAAEGRHEEALAHFRRRHAESGCPICSYPQLAELHEKGGSPDSAVVYYERYVSGDWLFRPGSDAMALPAIHERLARLYEDRGDMENARRHLERFIELWEDADPPLQPRVQAAREKLVALGDA